MRRALAVACLLSLIAALGIGCNSKTAANDRRCRTLSAAECRADDTCVAVSGPQLEPYPDAIQQGKRCEPGCAKGFMAEECVWAKAGSDPAEVRVANDGRLCTGPARCELRQTSSGAYCVDPRPPCGGCRGVFAKCQSANLCSDVICL